MILGRVTAGREAILPIRIRGLTGREIEVEAGIDTGYNGFLTAGDNEALQGALVKMPAEEAEALVEQLRAAQDDFDADAVGEADLDVAALEGLNIEAH